MGLFSFGHRRPPPTIYGYQPPEGAIAQSWGCTNKKCGTFKHEPDSRKWPKQCPACGSLIGTDSLEEPWEHEAKRIEIDWKLQYPDENNSYSTKLADLLWHFEDALLTGDSKRAEEQKNSIFDLLDPDHISLVVIGV